MADDSGERYEVTHVGTGHYDSNRYKNINDVKFSEGGNLRPYSSYLRKAYLVEKSHAADLLALSEKHRLSPKHLIRGDDSPKPKPPKNKMTLTEVCRVDKEAAKTGGIIGRMIPLESDRGKRAVYMITEIDTAFERVRFKRVWGRIGSLGNQESVTLHQMKEWKPINKNYPGSLWHGKILYAAFKDMKRREMKEWEGRRCT